MHSLVFSIAKIVNHGMNSVYVMFVYFMCICIYYSINGREKSKQKLISNNPSAQAFRLIIRQLLVDSLTTHNREAKLT